MSSTQDDSSASSELVSHSPTEPKDGGRDGDSPTAPMKKLTDGRDDGDYKSRYGKLVWLHVTAELLYLLMVLILAMYFLLTIALRVTDGDELIWLGQSLGAHPANHDVLIWVVMGISGLIGGTSSTLKWLYHTFAKQTWNRDRTLWRIVVPFLSSILAVFTGMMVSRGLLPPIFSQTAFDSLVFDAGLGFFLGYFSDNLLAWLTRKARLAFGTIDEKIKGRRDD